MLERSGELARHRGGVVAVLRFHSLRLLSVILAHVGDLFEGENHRRLIEAFV